MLPELEDRIRLEPHPARLEIHGVKVEAFPKLRQVMVNGVRVAYCGATPGHHVTFIRHYPDEYQQSIVEFVESQVGTVKGISAPPIVADVDTPAEEDDE